MGKVIEEASSENSTLTGKSNTGLKAEPVNLLAKQPDLTTDVKEEPARKSKSQVVDSAGTGTASYLGVQGIQQQGSQRFVQHAENGMPVAASLPCGTGDLAAVAYNLVDCLANKAMLQVLAEVSTGELHRQRARQALQAQQLLVQLPTEELRQQQPEHAKQAQHHQTLDPSQTVVGVGARTAGALGSVRTGACESPDAVESAVGGPQQPSKQGPAALGELERGGNCHELGDGSASNASCCAGCAALAAMQPKMGEQADVQRDLAQVSRLKHPRSTMDEAAAVMARAGGTLMPPPGSFYLLPASALVCPTPHRSAAPAAPDSYPCIAARSVALQTEAVVEAVGAKEPQASMLDAGAADNERPSSPQVGAFTSCRRTTGPCVLQMAPETDRIHLVLFGVQNRTFGRYLAANSRILISLMARPQFSPLRCNFENRSLEETAKMVRAEGPRRESGCRTKLSWRNKALVARTVLEPRAPMARGTMASSMAAVEQLTEGNPPMGATPRRRQRPLLGRRRAGSKAPVPPLAVKSRTAAPLTPLAACCRAFPALPDMRSLPRMWEAWS
jgi:hypothetical protein